MNVKAGMQCLCILSVCISLPLHAEDKPTVSGFAVKENEQIQLLPSELVEIDKNFIYQWGNKDHLAKKTDIKEVEHAISKSNDFSLLSRKDIEAKGRLYSKLGIYYAHVENDTNSGITKMLMADRFLTNKDDKSWNYNNLAYAYEKKYATSAQLADKENSLLYIGKVIENYSKENEKVAFAYCLKGYISKDDKNYVEAEKNFTQALAIYKKVNADNVDHFEKVKNYLDTVQNQELVVNGDIKKPLELLIAFYQKFLPLTHANAYCDQQII